MNEADYDKDLNWDEEIPLQRNPTIEGESIAGTLCALFRTVDYDFGVALLANSSHALEQWKSGTKTFYRWRSTAPPRLFVEYKRQVRWATNDWGNATDWHEDDFHARAWDLGEETLKAAGLRDQRDILVDAAKENDPGWRRYAQEYLTGQGINNQGNVVAMNRPRIIHDELVFRSMSETYVHDAFLRRGIPFMPLPVVMRADGSKRIDKTTNRRIEPDFALLYRGKFLVVELDGGSHVHQSPVEADGRVKFLRERGAIVYRLDADRCKDIETALLAVKDLLESVDREIDAHRR